MRLFDYIVVMVVAAKWLALTGVAALTLGLVLLALGAEAGWLAWLGAVLSLVASASAYGLSRSFQGAVDRHMEQALTTIYMPLLDESTDAWRPVEAMKIGDLGYMVTEPEPSGERWAFQPGHILRCEVKQLNDGSRLVAVANAT